MEMALYSRPFSHARDPSQSHMPRTGPESITELPTKAAYTLHLHPRGQSREYEKGPDGSVASRLVMPNRHVTDFDVKIRYCYNHSLKMLDEITLVEDRSALVRHSNIRRQMFNYGVREVSYIAEIEYGLR